MPDQPDAIDLFRHPTRVGGAAYVTATNRLRLGPCGITIDLETGEVSVPESLPLTTASRVFWEAVGGHASFW
jgi:hypothetical protein